MSAKKSSSRKRAKTEETPSKKSSFLKDRLILGLIIAIIIIIAVALIMLYVNSLDTNGDGDDSLDTNGDGDDNDNDDIVEGNPIALIETSMGSIRVELYEDKVPNTVENFVKLVNDGFYDGLVFHRVMDDFMIQGGGFESDGTNKASPYGTIDLEIVSDVRHVDGAIAMARTNDPNSATSQFYICDGAQSFLDDNYAAFGVVIEGIEVVRLIALVETTTKNGMSDWPVNDVIINSIIIE